MWCRDTQKLTKCHIVSSTESISDQVGAEVIVSECPAAYFLLSGFILAFDTLRAGNGGNEGRKPGLRYFALESSQMAAHEAYNFIVAVYVMLGISNWYIIRR